MHFHSDIENLRKGLAAEIESDAQLELSGELDLEKVKMLWGLESCAVSNRCTCVSSLGLRTDLSISLSTPCDG